MERREMSISDIFKRKESYGVHRYGTYAMCYEQDTCELHRWPELYEMFKKHDLSFEYSNYWSFARIRQATYAKNPDVDVKELVHLLFQCFQGSERVVVVGFEKGRLGDLELRSTSLSTREPFDAYRNRMLFKLRDYLGIPHHGFGKDSIRIWSEVFPQPLNYEI